MDKTLLEQMEEILDRVATGKGTAAQNRKDARSVLVALAAERKSAKAEEGTRRADRALLKAFADSLDEEDD